MNQPSILSRDGLSGVEFKKLGEDLEDVRDVLLARSVLSSALI